MRCKSLFTWVLFALLTALVLAPASAAAPAVRTDFTGTEMPLGPPVDHGVWIELPSGNVHGRGMVSLYQEAASDPRMSGINRGVLNANWGPDGSGPMWGTSHSEVAQSPDCEEGGTWEGTWTGMMSADGSYSYRAVGRGISGCVEGLRYALIAVNLGAGKPTTYTGAILESHGE